MNTPRPKLVTAIEPTNELDLSAIDTAGNEPEFTEVERPTAPHPEVDKPQPETPPAPAPILAAASITPATIDDEAVLITAGIDRSTRALSELFAETKASLDHAQMQTIAAATQAKTFVLAHAAMAKRLRRLSDDAKLQTEEARREFDRLSSATV